MGKGRERRNDESNREREREWFKVKELDQRPETDLTRPY